MKKTALLFYAIVVTLASLSQDPLNIMTFNIRYDNPQDGVNAWPNRKEKVAALIRKYDADVIGLQEAMLI